MKTLSESQKAEMYDLIISNGWVDMNKVDQFTRDQLRAVENRINGILARLQPEGTNEIPQAQAVKPRSVGKTQVRKGPSNPPATAAGGQSTRAEALQLASRQLQGRYLALIRRFPPTKRTFYSKLAKDQGREKAIKEMTSALKTGGRAGKPGPKPAKPQVTAAKKRATGRTDNAAPSSPRTPAGGGISLIPG